MNQEITQEQKLKKIYEEIADKTLSFGCIINPKEHPNKVVARIYPTPGRLTRVCKVIKFDTGMSRGIEKIYAISDAYNTYFDQIDWDFYEKIGHPVMIGDFFEWQIKNSKHSNITEERLFLIGIWKDKTKPIDQEPEAINYVYSLIESH